MRNKMETGFDKEIDALLRDRGLRTITTAERSLVGEHLDADALSGFAENALPANTRAVYISHLADCGDCRAGISNIIATQEPTATEQTVAAHVIEAAPVPWFRKLLRAPNLAYVMGGLVFVFGGLITISLFQNMYLVSDRAASNAAESMPASQAQIEEDIDFDSSEEAAKSAVGEYEDSIPANTTANKHAESLADRVAANRSSDTRRSEKLDDVFETAVPIPTPQPTQRFDEEGAIIPMADAARPADAEDAKEMARQPQAPVAAAPAPQASPGRGVQRDGPELEYKAREARRTAKSEASPTRVVSGKTFDQRDNVWYDREYKGGTTTNVRRSTDAYRKLDSGLRAITNQLSGTVIVVWKETSYRIQ